MVELVPVRPVRPHTTSTGVCLFHSELRRFPFVSWLIFLLVTQVDSDNTPKTSRHIRDLGKNKSPATRRRYSVISKGFEAQESKIASLSSRIASLEEEVGRLSRGKKRKAIPNPNKKFMTLAETLVANDTISEPNEATVVADAVEDVIEVGGMGEDESLNSEAEELPVVRTRAGRAVKRPR